MRREEKGCAMRSYIREMKGLLGLAVILAAMLVGMAVLGAGNAVAAPVGNNAAVGTMTVVQSAVPGANDRSDFNRAFFNRPFFDRPAFNPFFAGPAFNPFFAAPAINPFFASPAINPFFVRPAFSPFFNPFFDVDVDEFGLFEFDEFDD